MGQEYDAFGNPVGEKTASGLGTTPTPTPVAPDRKAPQQPARPAPTPTAIAPPRSPGSTGSGTRALAVLLRGVVALAVVGVLVAVIAGALNTDTSKIGDKLVPNVTVSSSGSESDV